MASIPGVRFDITGASGSQGLLAPQASWKAYILPRGGYASQSSTGTLITFDSAAVASRFATNQWIQAGLLTANIRQVSAVGGNSISVSGSNLTVTANDRIFLIGSTQPTVSGGSATYTVPASTIRQRDDDAATIYANSMVTSDANGLVQFFSDPALYDCLIQDGNGTNQGSIVDLAVGAVEGISTSFASVFGVTVTFLAGISTNGQAAFGQTVTFAGNIGATFTVSNNAIVGKLRTATEPVFNVKHPTYGAVGDGTTDDTTAITAALTAANAQGGGTVYLEAGTYIVTSTITVPTHCHLIGAGKDHTVIKGKTTSFSTPTTGVLRIGPTESHWAVIENIAVDCSNIDNITGVLFDGAQEYSGARDVDVINNGGATTMGFHYKTTSCQNAYSKGCGPIGTSAAVNIQNTGGALTFEQFSTGSAYGWAIASGSRNTLIQCHCECSTVAFDISGFDTTLIGCDTANTGISIRVNSGSWAYTIIGFRGDSTNSGLTLDENNLGTLYDIPTGTQSIPFLSVGRSSVGGNACIVSSHGYLPASRFSEGLKFNPVTTVGASTTTVLPVGNFFNITGVTTITSISLNALDNGRMIFLKFANNTSMTDGGNLSLAGNLTGATYSTISLICDGVSWHEMSRSAN